MLELDELSVACEACDAELDDANPAIAVRTDAGERRAYECACGAVTVTVAADRGV